MSYKLRILIKAFLLLFVNWLLINSAIATNLMEVVSYSLDQHPAILYNISLVDGSQYRYYQSFSKFLPEISFNRNEYHEKTNNSSNGIPEPVYFTTRSKDFTLKQNLFSGLKDFHNNRSAFWAYKSKRSNAIYNINSQIFDIIVNYINVLQQQKILMLAVENQNFFKKTMKKLELLYEKGTADKADYLLVKNNLQNAQSNTLQSKKDYDSMCTKFKNLVNLEANDLKPLKPISKYIPLEMSKLIDLTIQSNPSIKEIQAKINALEYELRQSTGSMMPNVDLQVSKNQAANLSGIKGKSGNTKVGLTFNLNLLNGGQDYLEIKAKQTEKEGLLHQLENTIRTVKQDLNETWLARQNSINKSNFINDQIISSQQSLNAYLSLLNYNRSYLLNVLNAKKLLLTSQIDNITNHGAKLINEYRILLITNTLLETLESAYQKTETNNISSVSKKSNPPTNIEEPLITLENTTDNPSINPTPKTVNNQVTNTITNTNQKNVNNPVINTNKDITPKTNQANSLTNTIIDPKKTKSINKNTTVNLESQQKNVAKKINKPNIVLKIEELILLQKYINYYDRLIQDLINHTSNKINPTLSENKPIKVNKVTPAITISYANLIQNHVANYNSNIQQLLNSRSIYQRSSSNPPKISNKIVPSEILKVQDIKSKFYAKTENTKTKNTKIENVKIENTKIIDKFAEELTKYNKIINNYLVSNQKPNKIIKANHHPVKVKNKEILTKTYKNSLENQLKEHKFNPKNHNTKIIDEFSEELIKYNKIINNYLVSNQKPNKILKSNNHSIKAKNNKEIFSETYKTSLEDQLKEYNEIINQKLIKQLKKS